MIRIYETITIRNFLQSFFKRDIHTKYAHSIPVAIECYSDNMNGNDERNRFGLSQIIQFCLYKIQ